MAGLVVSAAVVSGELILGLSDGQIIRAGYVQGPTGLQGPQGPMGATGRPGTDGNGLLHGAGVPLFDDGKDGDFYIDTKELKFYGPKVGGKWGSGVALRPKPASQTLPTGMKAQGGGIGGNSIFMAGGGGGGGSIAPLALPPPSWLLIANNKKPLLASTPAIVTSDTGLAVHCMLRGESAGGAHYLELVAVRRDPTSTETGYSIAWEVQVGPAAPTLIPTASIVGGKLTVSVTCSDPLISLSGAYKFI